MEDLQNFGYFKYLAYPLKKIYSFTMNTMSCCKRSDAGGPGSDPEDEEEEDYESQEGNY